jgi:hypothetical protein
MFLHYQDQSIDMVGENNLFFLRTIEDINTVWEIGEIMNVIGSGTYVYQCI